MLVDRADLTPAIPPAPLQGGEAIRAQVQNDVRDAMREAAREIRDGVREARSAQGGAVTVVGAPADKATIDALNAQIAGERANIERLTSQLTSGTTDAAEGVITDQIEQSQERLSSLQRQLDQALGVSNAAPEVFIPPIPPGEMIPPQVVEITQGFFFTVAVIAIGIPLARAFGRWLDRRGQPAAAPSTSQLEPRLDRIEQAIEAIAIEVERVSEGQRYTNKLMGEMRALPAPNPLEQWPQGAVKEAVPAERRTER